jgi:hypothetical protein
MLALLPSGNFQAWTPVLGQPWFAELAQDPNAASIRQLPLVLQSQLTDLHRQTEQAARAMAVQQMQVRGWGYGLSLPPHDVLQVVTQLSKHSPRMQA